MTDPDPTSRPTDACLLHRPPLDGHHWTRATDGYTTCDRCLDRLRDLLRELDQRYLILTAANRTLPGATAGIRGAPGYGPRSPSDDRAIAMTDPRSKTWEVSWDRIEYIWDPLADTTLTPGQLGPPAGAYVDQRAVWTAADGRGHTEQPNPPRSIPSALASLAALVAEMRGHTAPPPGRSVYDLTRWLDQQLDWITRTDWVVELAAEIRDLVNQLKPYSGDERHLIGHCPNTIDTGDTTTACGARLYAPVRGDTITCSNPACRRQWPRSEWLRLGDLLDSA